MSQSQVCHQYASNGICTYGTRCRFQHIASAVDGSSQVSYTYIAACDVMMSTGQVADLSQTPPPQKKQGAEQRPHSFGWSYDDDEDSEKSRARRLLKDALTLQFNEIYGTDAGDIDSWRNLCQILEIAPIPEDLDACRGVVKATHVNIVDLIDTPNTGDRVGKFPSEFRLSEYTKATGKYFPRDNAYAGGLLRYLLRRIDNPPAERVKTRRRKRKV
ncbi:hypothetical protein JAAARDRAFT_197531 [Jaapia argillacea MUCL 33604]|uniref:C3H1-type domain-containing protein n=1 Tax=Jaapia argillacea MUCL 33604 TaxID=933084 RepID=A0A067PQ03_9AGAM|nr:hypothetical protein JAAARDRAFT_197531 [Jaapia argillacea MUCL 33604]